jgi:hypothetical protein
MKSEIRVKEVTRYIVTRYDGHSLATLCETDNKAFAHVVAEALRSQAATNKERDLEMLRYMEARPKAFSPDLIACFKETQGL